LNKPLWQSYLRKTLQKRKLTRIRTCLI